MGTGGADGFAEFMGDENPQGAAVIKYTNAIGNAVEAVAVIGLLTGGDDLLEGAAILCRNQEVAAREGLLSDVRIRHRVEHTCPGVVRIAGKIDQLLTQLKGGLDDFLAFGPVAIPGIEVVGDFAGFVEQSLLLSRQCLAGGKLLQRAGILRKNFWIASIEQ